MNSSETACHIFQIKMDISDAIALPGRRFGVIIHDLGQELVDLEIRLQLERDLNWPLDGIILDIFLGGVFLCGLCCGQFGCAFDGIFHMPQLVF